ncbi:hypothetical protein [Geobacter argillaceus]|uniref:hypothetical protein n=1 Tax=Geobacter argillaceus TaxID=345631 RepID=UPI00119DA5BE|nr:hypothetical protein [Geobacter argillaceus]
MTQHALSILLATYSGVSCLPAPLDSLLDQTHADWQLLVRDDGCTVLGQGAGFLDRYRDRLTPGQRGGA